MENKEIIDVFSQLAFHLTSKKENRKAIAFRKVVKALSELDERIEDIDWNTRKVKQVGKSSISIIKEVLETGKCKRLEEMAASLPPKEVEELQKLPGVGPVGARSIWHIHKIKSLAELRKAIDEGIITDKSLIEKLEWVESSSEYCPRPWAEIEGLKVIELLKPYAVSEDHIQFAGSIRRKADLIRDIDIVIALDEYYTTEMIYKALEKAGYNISYGGDTKIRIEYNVKGEPRGGDILITTQDEWACALLYFTGSREFNIAIRKLAKKMGYKLNEYGLVKI